MKRDTTSVVLVALLVILLAALLTGGPIIGWGMMRGMMRGTYVVSPVAAILTVLLGGLAIAGIVLLIFRLVDGPTSPRQSKS